jgi:hypothetical protein
MTKLDRWLPASVTLGTWAGFWWLKGPYAPLDGFLFGAAAVIGLGAIGAFLGHMDS